MKNNEEKFENSNILEGMTSISALIGAPLENQRKIEKIWFDDSKKKSKERELRFLQAKSTELGFSIEFVSAEELDKVANGKTHGGILAFCTAREILSLTNQSIKPNGFYVYLDGVEDPYNFGYILRTLYAAGATGAILPPRNWMSAAGVVARSSAGASESMPLFISEANEAIAMFRAAGYRIMCAGIRDSVSIYEAELSYPIFLVIGGEKRGISRNILEKADQILRIDYGREFRGSLSAASAASVMAFEILRQNKYKK